MNCAFIEKNPDTHKRRESWLERVFYEQRDISNRSFGDQSGCDSEKHQKYQFGSIPIVRESEGFYAQASINPKSERVCFKENRVD